MMLLSLSHCTVLAIQDEFKQTGAHRPSDDNRTKTARSADLPLLLTT